MAFLGAEADDVKTRQAGGKPQLFLPCAITCQIIIIMLSRTTTFWRLTDTATFLVRLLHRFESHLSRTRYETALDAFMETLVWRQVQDLLANAELWRRENQIVLRFGSEGLTAADGHLAGQLFNHTIFSDAIVCWCVPGCCAGRETAVEKAKCRARLLVCNYPSVPLMDRFKHWAPAAAAFAIWWYSLFSPGAGHFGRGGGA